MRDILTATEELQMEDLEAFYSPFSGTILLKGDKDDPDVIYIEASNEGVDKQKDILVMKALEDETESFLKSGILSWDHLHKIKGSPEYIIGEPLDVKFEDRKTWVKGKLYKAVKYAQAIKDLLASGSTRIGASVGGFIRKRKELGKSASAILRVIWDELALTYKPVNEQTMGNVSLIPIGAFGKALMAGVGVNPESFSGGRAITPESLQGNVDKKEIMVEFVWRLENGDIRTDDDIKDFLEYYNAQSLYDPLKKILMNKYGR